MERGRWREVGEMEVERWKWRERNIVKIYRPSRQYYNTIEREVIW